MAPGLEVGAETETEADAPTGVRPPDAAPGNEPPEPVEGWGDDA